MSTRNGTLGAEVRLELDAIIYFKIELKKITHAGKLITCLIFMQGPRVQTSKDLILFCFLL